MSSTRNERIEASEDFEVLAPVPVNLVCFRYHPVGVDDPDEMDRLNQELLERLNATGKLYLTHTRLGGVFTLRLVVGQTRVEQGHVEKAWELIRSTAMQL